MENGLTTGSVAKTMASFSLPFLLSYCLQSLYGMADLFIVGQFESVAAVTAVSVGSQVMHMLTVMLVGLAMGATVMVGRATGAGRRAEAAEAIGNTVTLFGAVSLILCAALLCAVRPIVALTAAPPEAAAATAAYLRICFAGIPCITAYNSISAILRGMGDSKSPMYFIAVACAANIALDYLFIGVCGFGAAGAALGTVAAQTLSVAVSLAVLVRRRGSVRLRRAHLRPQRRAMLQLLRVGAPVALQDGFIQVSFMVITVIANRRGLTDAAAVGIVEKWIGMLFLVPSSMLSTVSALCAQNLGANKPERARRTLGLAVAVSVGFGVLAAAVMLLFAEPVVGWFEQDPAVMTRGGQYLRGYVWDCLFAGIHFCFSGYFCACGRSGVSFWHNCISILCVRIPFAYLASVRFADTLLPMGLASTAGSILSALICAGVFWRQCRRQLHAAPTDR